MENNSSNIEVSKTFDCPKEQLYAAWTQPDQLKQWWKPMGHQLTEVVNDLKEGGEVKYVFENDSLTIDGKYEKVEEQSLLEYTWNWHLKGDKVDDASYKLSVQFEGADQQSSIHVTQSGFESEEHIQPHQQGWEQGLQQLHDYLSGNSEGAANSGGENGEQNAELNKEQKAAEEKMPPVTGYNETPEQAKVAGG